MEKAASLGLTHAEWHILCDVLGFSLRPPGDRQHSSASARESAERSLRERNIVSPDGLRVAQPVAALLFSLAHPETSVWARPHGSVHHTAQVAVNRRVSSVAWLETGVIHLAHTTRQRAGRDLARLVAGEITKTPTHETFSLSGGLWHDLLTQASVATSRALESLARAEGVNDIRQPLVAQLARAAPGRVDLWCTRRSGRATWSGGEISLLRTDTSVWSVKDGRAFDSASRRASSRAVFTNVEPGELLGRLMTS